MEILEANCECVAGKGTKAGCKHIATFAYAILHFKEHKNWYIRTTCTSNRQVWHMPKKSKYLIYPQKKSEDISFAIPEYWVKKNTNQTCVLILDQTLLKTCHLLMLIIWII